jgi:uncharacterized metal-binding protein YceD (DUF177 family)
MTASEFSRMERIDTFGAGERVVDIVANAAERAALAERFGLLSLDALKASFKVRMEATGIVARGTVSASVVQACSVTDEPIPAEIVEQVALRFVEEAAVDSEEIELSEDALDTMFYAGSAIDLGEAAAETVALALDPFPRGPNAAAALAAAGVIGEDEVKPLGALAGLKGLLEKK